MKRLLIIMLLIPIFSIFLTSCSGGTEEGPINSIPEEKMTVAVWNVYWDHDNIEKEITALQDDINEICYFAAYFDSSHNLFVPKQVTANFNRVQKAFQETDYRHYLSIVNDKVNPDGTSSLKDTKLLYQLFEDENNLESHMDQMINMAQEGGYDGIEIDYEGMKKDEQLWELFANYCRELYEKLEAKNLKMRIVLEPSLPTYELNLPLGPDYVMMCYNLYGLGTGPGPKANQTFIRELVDKMKYLPGKKSFAFATGGFDWAEDGTVISLTEQQAKEIMNNYKTTPMRDEESQCITYTYIDEQQARHEVWFADAMTLNFWMQTVKDTGQYNFSIWRLNGNDWGQSPFSVMK